MIGFLRNNLVWMILALVISVGLWLSVTIEQNPTESNWFPSIPVEVKDLPGGMALRSDVPAVRVLVSAPRDVWQSRALQADRLQASLDASTAGPGLNDLPVQVASLDSRAKIDAVDPSSILLRLEPIKKRNVPVRVRLAGTVPLGFESQQPVVTPAEVVITGPSSLVDQVSAASARVSLDGARSSISQDVRIDPENDAGTVVDRVTVAPDRVLVEVRVDQQLAYKTLSVSPRVVGTAAFGYQIDNVMVEPSTTTVVGDPKALADLPFLQTKPVDITNAQADIALYVEPTLPAGVSLVRSQPILVRVLVTPIEGNKVLEIVPTVRGATNRQISVNPGTVRITLAGPLPSLTRLTLQDVQVVADVTWLQPGTSQVRLVTKVPDNVNVVDVQPVEVSVTIR